MTTVSKENLRCFGFQSDISLNVRGIRRGRTRVGEARKKEKRRNERERKYRRGRARSGGGRGRRETARALIGSRID